MTAPTEQRCWLFDDDPDDANKDVPCSEPVATEIRIRPYGRLAPSIPLPVCTGHATAWEVEEGLGTLRWAARANQIFMLVAGLVVSLAATCLAWSLVETFWPRMLLSIGITSVLSIPMEIVFWRWYSRWSFTYALQRRIR